MVSTFSLQTCTMLSHGSHVQSVQLMPSAGLGLGLKDEKAPACPQGWGGEHWHGVCIVSTNVIFNPVAESERAS